MMQQSYANYRTVHRRLLSQLQVLRRILMNVADEFRGQRRAGRRSVPQCGDRSGLLAHRLFSSLSAPALVHREERNDILPPEPFCQGERKKFPHD